MDMARTMLNESKLNEKIWGQAVHTTIHIIKKGLLKRKSDKKSLRAMDRKNEKCTTVQNI